MVNLVGPVGVLAWGPFKLLLMASSAVMRTGAASRDGATVANAPPRVVFARALSRDANIAVVRFAIAVKWSFLGAEVSLRRCCDEVKRDTH